MFKYIFVILFFFFTMLFLLGFSVVRTLMNFFFGSSNKKQAPPKGKGRQQSAKSRQNPGDIRSNGKSRKKLISEDEGEYVDYEEIK